jgi:two-component system chemotaxis response regulator CheY
VIDFAKLRILIVDDSAPVRVLARTILQGLGPVQVRMCADGAEALREMAHWAPGLVLIDYEMRPVNGVEFTRRVRANTAMASTPIIMMTGHTDRARVDAARAAGIDGFVVKPLSIQAVLARVQSVLAKRAAAAPAPGRTVVSLPIEADEDARRRLEL